MDHLARPIAASLLVLAACSGDSGTSMSPLGRNEGFSYVI
jgi:hypothetical protein